MHLPLDFNHSKVYNINILTQRLLLRPIERCSKYDKKAVALVCIAVPVRCGIFYFPEVFMETRVAVMGIIVENKESTEALNAVLHAYGDYIVGRMGIPYPKKGINIISVAIDAPQDTISALSGKIGKIDGVSVKTAYSNVISNE